MLSFGKQFQMRAAAHEARAAFTSYPSGYESRYTPTRVVRSGQGAGKNVLEGYAATFNLLSQNFGGWRERIKPGAFSRALRENQDIRHLQNHDQNLVLGRSASGTLRLSEDSKGLRFQTDLPSVSYALDLAELVGRGDVNEMSFGFICVSDSWTREADPETNEMIKIRELLDVDLIDVSTVTYPAYPGTSAGLQARMKSMFPASGGELPAEIRNRLGVTPQKPFGLDARGMVPLATMQALERGAIAVRAAQERVWLQLAAVHSEYSAPTIAYVPSGPISSAEQSERADLKNWAERIITASARPLGL